MGLSANTTRTNKYVYANLFCIQHYGGVIFENHFGDMSCCSGQLWDPKSKILLLLYLFLPCRKPYSFTVKLTVLSER